MSTILSCRGRESSVAINQLWAVDKVWHLLLQPPAAGLALLTELGSGIRAGVPARQVPEDCHGQAEWLQPRVPRGTALRTEKQVGVRMQAASRTPA